MQQITIKNNKYDNIDKLNIKIKAMNELNINKLPDDVTISTMTIVCKINTKFNCGNIARYIDLKTDNIVSVIHGKNGDPETNRAIIINKNNIGKIKKKKCFL